MSESKKLPGATIPTTHFGCCGQHTNHFGVGEFSISGSRPGPYPWLDVGYVFYSAPTQHQLLDADTSPFGTEGDRAKSDIRRRMSEKQAQLVTDIFLRALKDHFGVNGIPADDEIAEWRAANGYHFS
jgi:hypothetical protein